MRSKIVVMLFAAVLISVFGCGNSPSAEAANKKAAPVQVTKKQAPARKTDSAPKPATAKKLIKAWDFTSDDPANWESVSYPDKKKTPQGALVSGGANFVLKLGMDFSECDMIKVEFGPASAEKDGPLVLAPKKPLLVFWASPDQTKAGQWPYANDRGTELTSDPKSPNMWGAFLGGVSTWKGKIDTLLLDIPTDKKPEGKIAIKRIELLK